MLTDAFVSYSRRDEDFIKQLYQALVDREISAWYDRENIRIGNQWTSEIVEGIRDCKVFVLVLSPDSTASVNVRKEVDLAQRYKKEIIPIFWRPTEVPVAMEYQLAGIQWMDFNEEASEDKYNQLAGVIRRLMGGASMAEASSDTQIAKESTIPAIQQEAAASEQAPAKGRKRLGGSRRRSGSGLKKKQTVYPIATGATVISGVVVTLGLDIEEQDFVNEELKWLFSAVDNFIKIRRSETERSQPVPAPIPEDAERDEGVTNQLLDTIGDFDLPVIEQQIEAGFGRMDTHLSNLNMLLAREASLGGAGKADVALQNDLKTTRLDIIKILQQQAQLMNQAYGILVTSPDLLLERVEEG